MWNGNDRFIPTPLNKWERNLNRLVWFSHSFLAFIIAYYTTNGEIRPWIEHWLQNSSYLPDGKFDYSDSEWWFYKKNFFRIIACLIGNSILFRIFMKTSDSHLKWCLLGGQFGLHIALTSILCVLTCALITSIIIGLVWFFRKEAIAWILCIAFILQCSKIAPFSTSSYVYYLEFNLYAYTCLKIINIGIYLCRQKLGNKENKADDHLLMDTLTYLLYLPFSITLIVLFDDFRNQLNHLRNHGRRENLIDLLIFAIRLVVWLISLDILMHFIYANAVFSSPDTLLYGMNSYQVMSISYVVGQFFHMKYVVIFGVPALFAKIDGMKPPPPPICVSRVSRYSRMWRNFDGGLYEFLKNQVYVPLLKNVVGWKGILLRLLATLNVFLIVLVWHGFDSHYVYWVTLSAFELIIEWVGVATWQTSTFQKLRLHLGERGIRRLISIGMLFTVIPGIFGVFCFLGRAGIGTTVFYKVLIEGCSKFIKGDWIINSFPSSGLIFIHMLVLGYFFNNYTLEYDERKLKAK